MSEWVATLPRRAQQSQFQHPNAVKPGLLVTIGLIVVLILTIFEGAIRKWILNGELSTTSYAVYLSKDVIFVALLLCRRRFPLTPASRYFLRYLIFGGLFIIAGSILSSVEGVSAVGAVLTMRAMVLLPVVSLLLVQRLPSTALVPTAWIAAGAGLLNSLLSIVQTRLPPDHFLNQYAIAEMPIVTLETGVRAAGTFAYITGLAVLSTISVWAGLSLMSAAVSLRQKAAGWIAIVAGIICALASVSRAPLIIDALMVVAWATFARLSTQRVIAVVIAAAAVILGAAAAGLLPTAERLSDAFLERTGTAEDTLEERAFGQAEQAVTAIAVAPLGNGLGFEQVGGNYFSTGELAFANFEGQFPRIVMDTTVLGLVGYAIICLTALYALQMAKRGVSTSRRAVLWATQMLLASIFYGSEVYNHTASSFAWIIFAAAMATQNLVQPQRLRVVSQRKSSSLST